MVGPQSLQTSLHNLSDVLRPAVKSALLTGPGIDIEAELGGDDDLLSHRSQGFTHQFLVREGTVGFRRVEESDTVLDGGADERNALSLIDGRTIAEAQSLASQAQGRDFQAATECAFLHAVCSKESRL